ncbi:MAG: hypothetical protein HY908_23245 [Myxococcales bacterium]|nr:hypothetical protein [Myxococcales bacterium]
MRNNVRTLQVALASALAAGAACAREATAPAQPPAAPTSSVATRTAIATGSASAAAPGEPSAPVGEPSAPPAATSSAPATPPVAASPIAAELGAIQSFEDAEGALRRWGVTPRDLAHARRGQAYGRTVGHSAEELAAALGQTHAVVLANLDGDSDDEGVATIAIEDTTTVGLDGNFTTTTFVVVLDAAAGGVRGLGYRSFDPNVIGPVEVETKPIHSAAFHDVVVQYQTGGTCGLGCFAPNKVRAHWLVLTAERGKVDTLYQDEWQALPDDAVPKAVEITGPPPAELLVTEAVPITNILQRRERTLKFDAAAFKYR